MDEFVEPHLRRLVAEHLGVGVEELVPDVSLRDDLAADSLDLVELAVALEGEFAIEVPERILDQVRTYSDLVDATTVLIRARCAAERPGAEPPARIWMRLAPATGQSTGTLERTGWLTPYTAETIGEDALRAGPGARLELTIAANTTEGFVRARRQFAGLGKRGALVNIRHGDGPPTPLTDPLLDHLTGTRTAVTVTGYSGDDPWQADDLIARVGQDHPLDRPRGLQAQFDLSVPSPNGFRALGATLDCAAEDGACTLVIDVSARVAGKDLFGRVSLRGGTPPTMDVRL